jgi:hypothetical protein
MDVFVMRLGRILMYVSSVFLCACASMDGMQDRYAVCSYDLAWDAALDAVKDRSVTVKDKDKGLIETGWLEIPMPGQTYGALQRELGGSKDRSRIILTVTRLDDVAKISFAEERQRWAFRGGSRLFGWAETEASEEVLTDVHTRLGAKLKERGCTAS